MLPSNIQQLCGMIQDIRTCTNLGQLERLAALQGEYPHVFTPTVRKMLAKRKHYLLSRKRLRSK